MRHQATSPGSANLWHHVNSTQTELIEYESRFVGHLPHDGASHDEASPHGNPSRAAALSKLILE